MRTTKIISRWAIRVTGALALVSVPTVALAFPTNWCSEETYPVTCGPHGTRYGARGLHCRGDYCDEVALECGGSIPFFFMEPVWSRWFSEEVGTGPQGPWENRHVCVTPSGSIGVVTGIRCRGDYCDDISLECAEVWKSDPAVGFARVSPQNCVWTGRISEETPSYVSTDRFVSGVLCLGDYCDDKMLLMCTL